MSSWDNPVDFGGVDFSGTVIEAMFTASEEYNRVQLTLTVKRDEPYTREDGTIATESPVWFGVGDTQTWTIVDQGARILHKSGDADKAPSGNSAYGKLILRAVDDFKLRDAFKASGYQPTEAKVWIGHRFHFMTEGAGKAYKFKGRDGEMVEGTSKGATMPVEYLGTKDAPVSGTVGAAVEDAAFDPASLGLSTDIMGKLEAAAQEATSKDEFLNAAFGLDIDMSNDKVTDALGSGKLYEALKG